MDRPLFIGTKTSCTGEFSGDDVGTTSGHFRNRSEFDPNLSFQQRRDSGERSAPSKRKGKKHTSGDSSSGRRSISSNLGYSDSFDSTQGHYPPERPPSLPIPHGYIMSSHGYYPSYPNYGVPYQQQMYPPPHLYPPQPQGYPPPYMYPQPLPYPTHQLVENHGQNANFYGYLFGQRSLESGQGSGQSEGEGFDPARHSTMW